MTVIVSATRAMTSDTLKQLARVFLENVEMLENPQTLQNKLSGPTAPPPYRVIGYRYTYRTYVLQLSQSIALYPLKFALSQPRGGGGGRYRSSSCPLEGIALYGGIAEIISPIAA